MKKNPLFVSAAIAALTFAACTGQGSKTENNSDSTTVAVADTSTVAADPSEAILDEATADAALNPSLLGKWSNNDDPTIDLLVADKKGTYDDRKGFGYVLAANEYFEYDFSLVFTSVTPDGDNIRVHYEKLESYCTGDPDDYDSEESGEWIEKKVGEGELTLIPQPGNKLKIESSEPRIKNKVLGKVQD